MILKLHVINRCSLSASLVQKVNEAIVNIRIALALRNRLKDSGELIIQDIYNRKLSIYLQDGIDEDGKFITKVKTFSNVRLDTTDEKLSNFSQKYVALSVGIVILKILTINHVQLSLIIPSGI